MNNDVKYSCTVTPKVLTNNDDDFLERFCFEIPKCANIPAPYIKPTNDCSYFSSWYETSIPIITMLISRAITKVF